MLFLTCDGRPRFVPDAKVFNSSLLCEDCDSFSGGKNEDNFSGSDGMVNMFQVYEILLFVFLV